MVKFIFGTWCQTSADCRQIGVRLQFGLGLGYRIYRECYVKGVRLLGI